MDKELEERIKELQITASSREYLPKGATIARNLEPKRWPVLYLVTKMIAEAINDTYIIRWGKGDLRINSTVWHDSVGCVRRDKADVKIYYRSKRVFHQRIWPTSYGRESKIHTYIQGDWEDMIDGYYAEALAKETERKGKELLKEDRKHYRRLRRQAKRFGL